MGNNVFLGLGSNKGDRLKNLKDAVRELSSLTGSEITGCSFVYETRPYGGIEQQNFYNAVCRLKTALAPEELLNDVKSIEAKLGRLKGERWGPREIDIDILLYNDLIYTGESLVIPHRELLKRDFAVLPLLDISPDIIYPGSNIKLNEIVFTEKYIITKTEFNLLTTSGG